MKNTQQLFEDVVRILDLNNNSPRLVSIEYTDGLWEMRINTLTLIYDVYYDAEKQEVLGLDFEPITDLASVYDCVNHHILKIA